MNKPQRLLQLTAQLLDSPGHPVENLNDLDLLARCGLPLKARRGLVRLDPLQIDGQPLDLEETLAATMALLLTQPRRPSKRKSRVQTRRRTSSAPKPNKPRIRSSSVPAAAAKRSSGIAPS